MNITYRPIGVIHSPFRTMEEIPSPPDPSSHAPGSVEVFPEFAEGLQDVEGFSHLMLLFHLHLSEKSPLTVVPPRDSAPHGVFATRSPRRPNPIGMSVVRLVRREQNILHVEFVDVVDGTPLLDIKPYMKDGPNEVEIRLGWLEGK